MRLGIVGHAAEKFTEVTAKKALVVMGEAMFRHKATQVISGGCHMGGVDIWAKGKAISLGISVVEFVPTKRTWSGPGGYQERNLQIAEYCDVVLCVVVDEFPPGFKGMSFPYCYHCKGTRPPHIKSGGCWTAMRCKEAEWAVIHKDGSATGWRTTDAMRRL